MDLVVSRIDGTVEELLKQANLRADDIDQFSKFSNKHRQLEWLASKVIVWKKLQKHIDYASDGAPIVDECHISISHTGQFVAVLFSEDTRCGVDIELSSRKVAKAARKFTNAAEVEIAREIYASNPELVIWCAKEALYKYSRIVGADFINDFKILSATNNTLSATAFDTRVEVQIDLHDEILIARC